MSNKKINQNPNPKKPDERKEKSTPSFEDYTPPSGRRQSINEILQSNPTPQRKKSDSSDENK